MRSEEHVYCTLCKNFHMSNDEEDVYKIACPYENECYFFDPEDSAVFELRPHYEPIEE